jgi:hypothetical protein
MSCGPDFRTEKMGKMSSLQTISQNSGGNSAPWVFRFPKKLSRALDRYSSVRSIESRFHEHSSDFQILSIQNDVNKAKKHWEPEPDHRIIGLQYIFLPWWRIIETALRAFQHLWHEITEHSRRYKTDPLEFADFAKVSNANGQVSE